MRQADKVDEVSLYSLIWARLTISTSKMPFRKEPRSSLEVNEAIGPHITPPFSATLLRTVYVLHSHSLKGYADKQLIASEETFGPVAGLFRFSSEEEVVVCLSLHL